jgi:hypothetical protein
MILPTVQFILDEESLAFTRTLTERIVKLVIETSDIIAIPIARASLYKPPKLKSEISTHADPNTSTDTKGDAPSIVSGPSKYIDVFACLTLLQTVCTANATSPDREGIHQFWRHMKFDFVLLMLMKAQPLGQILLMLQLLQTSALEDSFGTIVGESPASERQAKHENDTIERLVLLLFELPTSGNQDRSNHEKKQQVEVDDVLQLRIEVLSVLESMCRTIHSTLALQTHRHALPRLFKFLHSTISSLYALPTPTPSTHKLLILSINKTMRILHHIITFQLNPSSTPEHTVTTRTAQYPKRTSTIDVRAALASILGGQHMHLISLTRLAFSERVAFEEGLWDGVVEGAHELLDEFLSPEEGEELLGCFSSGGSEG